MQMLFYYCGPLELQVTETQPGQGKKLNESAPWTRIQGVRVQWCDDVA